MLLLFLLLVPYAASQNQSCELDGSCLTTTEFVTGAPNETALVKWKYNISDTVANETSIEYVPINGTEGAEQNETVSNKTDTPNKSANKKYPMQIQDNCSCDLKKDSCDINCCCDPDCSNVNRDIFDNCTETENVSEEDYCPSKILNSPLLCIVKDNLYSKHYYPKHEVAEVTSSVDKLLRNRKVYGWIYPTFSIENVSNVPKDFKEYAIGSPIWIINSDHELKQWNMPHPNILSRDCQNTKPVKFLHKYEKSCTRLIVDGSAEICEREDSVFSSRKYFENVTIISNPIAINLSIGSNCTASKCIRVVPSFCESDDLSTCRSYNTTPTPVWLSHTNVCSQAVTSVHYVVHHNGTEGIMSINAYLELTDIRFKSPKMLWAQQFKISYQWVGQADAYELSGSPGYTNGRPIITGFKVFEPLKDNRTNEKLEFSRDSKRWLTFPRMMYHNWCSKRHRDNVLFRVETYVECYVKINKMNGSSGCELLQKEIFEILLGYNSNISNVYVSTLGQPDTSDSRKWVQVMSDLVGDGSNESCHTLITSLKMIIVHSIAGNYDNPQRTIVGLKVIGIPFERNISKLDKIKIGIGVNFYDVSKPPLREFAEPPTYEVKLPPDFFYPFFSTGNVIQLSLLLYVCVLVYVIF